MHASKQILDQHQSTLSTICRILCRSAQGIRIAADGVNSLRKQFDRINRAVDGLNLLFRAALRLMRTLGDVSS